MVMNMFTQLVYVIGRIDNGKVNMLGTGFLVSKNGKIVTSRHVIGDDDRNLVIILPHMQNINEYQDTTDTRCSTRSATIEASDPFRDTVILKVDISYEGYLPGLGSIDEVGVGEVVGILGFPHCVEGRRVLTFQQASVGAKVILDSNGIKSKHIVINTQSRPGQSGSLIVAPKNNKIVGLLVGTFAPESGVMIAGINPRELNQTTHCISIEYVRSMI